MFKKIEIKNLHTGDLVNQDIEYRTDVPQLMEHWYYNDTDFKHEEGVKNQKLVNVVGRRLTAAVNSNLRLNNCFSSGEYGIWKDMTMFEIDMSLIHCCYGINSLMWVPLKVKLYSTKISGNLSR